MPKIMLIDAAQSEETRVAVMDGKRLDNFDIESASKKQLKGNIYLAKVTRVEPSLQAAFVNYGGNRHGFLPFSEIHPDYYRIPIEDRERLIAEQEELSRQLQAEAQAREERELAEAEARAQRIAAGEDAEALPEEENEDAAVEMMEDVADELVDEAADEAEETAEGDDTADGEDDADMPEDEAADSEGTAEGEEILAAEGGDEAADAENGEQAVAGEGEQPRRGRGRGRRRGRGRARGRGLDRKPDQLVDREGSAPRESEEEESGMTSLWKRMRRNYKIQEVIKRGQIMLIQVVKEERGNKGAAVTTYITMPGRYCVLMPNSPQSGGVSRKVASHAERRKMRDLLDELQVPSGMSVILRTAGVDRAPEEIKRDLDYLMRLWDNVRDTTMQSTAPSLIHEEGSLVKRAVRDLYTKDISEVVVEGSAGARMARDMMSMMMPDHEHNVREYNDTVPLFIKYGAEPQIDAIHSSTVTLRSGGYLVINPTEALVSIDINSGRATRERHIEETALKTNLEAADEIARQLRLRDLGGLVVIDFIDMESRRHNAMVEKRMRDALSSDRARVQVGRISTFGLMELSRQRLRPSLTETHFVTCPHCRGLGMMRTVEAMGLAVLRAIETIGMENRAGELTISVTEPVATFLFNVKRAALALLESRYDLNVVINIAHSIDDDQGFRMDVTRSRRAERLGAIDSSVDGDLPEDEQTDEADNVQAESGDSQPRERSEDGDRDGGRRGRRRGRRGGRNRFRDREGEAGPDGGEGEQPSAEEGDDAVGNRKDDDGDAGVDGNDASFQPRGEDGDRDSNRRRRGRRGGRGRNRGERGERAPRDENGEANGNFKPAEDTVVIETVDVVANVRRAAPVAAEAETPVMRDYETVNEAPKEKKKGWWKKLTG